MNLSIYYAGPNDTPIANEDSDFVSQLSKSAGSFPFLATCNSPKNADIIVLDERYQYRTWHYIDELLKCGFVRQYADRICVVNHDSFARVFLPGLYTSLERRSFPLIDATPIPYKRDLWKITPPDSFEFNPSQLYSFVGTFHTHPIRYKLCKTLASIGLGTCKELRKAFHDHDENDQTQYIKQIRDAQFSLCPRGLSPSTYRLYESMQLGRCPVVISDDWLPPDGPDWEKFIIRVPEAEIDALPSILSQNSHRAEQYGRIAFDTWKRHFSWPQRYRYFTQRILDFFENRSMSRDFTELYDIWTSKQFRKTYGWTPSGRAGQLLKRHWNRFISHELFP
ncbi:MAG: exostosin domain-containing protein [bacterium]